MVGKTISHYRILGKLGEGGMGVVYRAEDLRLHRSVALKFLRPEALDSDELKARFFQEAEAAAALDHPNVCTIYEIDEADGQVFLAMAYVDGPTLKQKTAASLLQMDEAIDIAVQLCRGLEAAHRKGIVHRDIKSANIMIAPGGQVKIMDFGLARIAKRAGLTRTGASLGTPAYMSPEQARAQPVDQRTDIWSCGVVLYEMLRGRLPFEGESEHAVLYSIVHQEPPGLSEVRAGAPPRLGDILAKALAKDPRRRYQRAGELANDLLAAHGEPAGREPASPEETTRLWPPEPPPRPAGWRRMAARVSIVLFLVAVLAAASWALWRYSRTRWARNVALPEIARLEQAEDFWSAYRLAQHAARYIPENPVVSRWTASSPYTISITSSPPGAEVFVKSYMAPDAGWDLLGITPLRDISFPEAHVRIKVVKSGFDDAEGTFDPIVHQPISFELTRKGATPPGMVYVSKGPRGAALNQKLDEFWIDRFEVTNEQYKKFVDAGGYRKPVYWTQPIVGEIGEVAWKDAMHEFVDRTGRPGPATWELGSYPEGEARYPVRGVSWYEAAAYAEFAGKSLPTIFHWENAAGLGFFSSILRLSNFTGEGPVAAGSLPGAGPYGTYDMAGNVKEWCWNRVGDHRYIRGGAWNEPFYMFRSRDAQLPFARNENYGFRCVKYSSQPPRELTGPVPRGTPRGDEATLKPVNDEQFELIRGFYAYDPAELNAEVEEIDDPSPYWRKQRITFDAAYGDERVIAYLFLPKGGTPPFQCIVTCPPGGDVLMSSSRQALIGMSFFSFLTRTGRAVLYPILKGGYERRIEADRTAPSVRRDLMIARTKDLGRVIDYLETRADIDTGRLGFWGLSASAVRWPIYGAIEQRFRTAVLWTGGLSLRRRAPEVDRFNFAPRATTPVLLVHGSHDFVVLPEDAERLHRFLGAPEEDKKLVFFNGGHIPTKPDVLRKVTLDWYDRYLGPVGE